MQNSIKSWYSLTLALLGLLTNCAFAEATNEKSERDTYEHIFEQAIEGPSQIQLDNQATFTLPENMIYLPKQAANEFMDMLGNGKYPYRIGLVMPKTEDTDWFADISFNQVGYISDQDAKDWDVDALYQSLEEGNKEQNKERKIKNIPELELTGWVQKPTYDQEKHQLIWSVEGHEKGVVAEQPNTINYNTYLLGREGYIELNFITDQERIKTNKQIAQDLLSQIRFNPNKQYQDFNPSLDKTAEYGLAALIGGAVVAKKLGLFAIIGAFLVKFWKIGFIVLLAFGGVFTRIFGRKKN